MSPADNQRQLVDDFTILPDVQERLSAAVTRAAVRKMADVLKTDDALVRGCSSRVWLAHEGDARSVKFCAEADSPMVHGLVNLLVDVYSGCAARDIVQTEPELWQSLGFNKMLSPTRLNGLAAVRKRMVEIASSLLAVG